MAKGCPDGRLALLTRVCVNEFDLSVDRCKPTFRGHRGRLSRRASAMSAQQMHWRLGRLKPVRPGSVAG